MCVYLMVVHMLHKGKPMFAIHFDIVSEHENDIQLASVTFAPRRECNSNLDLSMDRDDLLN